MGKYGTAIDKKWQEIWEKNELYKFDAKNLDKKLYTLEMFSYPSGAQLHAGHWFNYGPVDSWARLKRMQGYNVFQPMGFDAFGLPAENYAIKTGIHPKDSTYKNIKTMEQQLKAMGAMFNWENEVITCDPEYYKWTQWLFLQLYKHGLAYRKKAPVNWCPSCNTVLANEQVVDGCCERCGTEVTKKDLTQWFLKITDYADELLDKLDDLDWPEKTVAMQKHWIGRSTGAEVTFKIKDSDLKFDVFTTRADTLNGVTYVVLAPENKLVDKLTTAENKEAVENYKETAAKQSEIERQSISKEKTGVFTGSYAINPINGREVPIWISDYVLATYGTGAVMAVPAHDERDFAFATKFNLPIERVITNKKGEEVELPYCEYGVITNSGEFNGLTTEEGKVKIVEKLEKQGLGHQKVNYRLRDWLVSRQRYWGAPIPIIYCDKCGTVPVPEENLPVELPYDVEFAPDGKSPLAKCEDFVNTTCPCCGGPAKREADTLDTFVCSSWYYLRYMDPHNDKELVSKEALEYWSPVDWYNGGMEHTTLHLLYSRFWHKFLYDIGIVPTKEPYQKRTAHGMILGSNGEKMSKSKGNVVNPDDIIEEFGADTFRVYEMFMGPFDQTAPWSMESIRGCGKFLDRVWNLQDMLIEGNSYSPEFEKMMHKAIKKVSSDIEEMKFNTCISTFMTMVNEFYKLKRINIAEFKTFLQLLNPFAPHITEELYERIGASITIAETEWPTYDEEKTIDDEIELPIQFNGKLKATVKIARDTDESTVKELVHANPTVINNLQNKTVIKEIYVKNKIYNIVVK